MPNRDKQEMQTVEQYRAGYLKEQQPPNEAYAMELLLNDMIRRIAYLENRIQMLLERPYYLLPV